MYSRVQARREVRFDRQRQLSGHRRSLILAIGSPAGLRW
jgi:hypothetical protein